jgi:two-component system sensor histidine kinase YesM
MKMQPIFSLNKFKLKEQMGVLIGIALIMMASTQYFFYYQFQNLTRIRAERYAESLVNQVAEQLYSHARNTEQGGSIIAYNRHIQEYLVTDDPERKHIILFPFVRDVLEYVRSSNENIYDIILAGADGRIITSLRSAYTYQHNMQQTIVFDYGINTAEFKNPLHTALLQNIDNMNYYAYIVPLFSIIPGNRFFEKIGFCVVVSNTESIERIISDIQLSENSGFIVLDGDNTIMVANKKEDQGKKFESLYSYILNEPDHENTLTDYQSKAIVQHRLLANTGWKVVSIIPEEELSADLQSIRRFGLLLGIFMILALVVSGIALIRNITLPVSRVVNFIEQVGKNGESQRLEIPAPNEVGIIAGYINRMLDDIEENMDKLLKAQKEYHDIELLKKEAELSALQNQINPHFLYNTLNCISSIALVNDISEIVTISEAMVKIFRYSIKQSDLVFIRDEIALIRDYMEIMNIRYLGRFTLVISVDEEILRLKTIRMILQPLAENAVYHGLEPKNGPGELSIHSSKISENVLQISIEDNGKGMGKKELAALQKALNTESLGEETSTGAKSIGLININRRIQLMFGKEYGVTIESRQNSGTLIVIFLPVINQ